MDFHLSPTFCCCLVAQLSPALCDHMDCSTPGFPILYYLLEFAQTHVPILETYVKNHKNIAIKSVNLYVGMFLKEIIQNPLYKLFIIVLLKIMKILETT